MGCLRGPSGSGVSKRCSESVPKVSGHLFDTPLRSPGPEGPWRHPVGHSLGHPPFSGTPCHTLSGRLRARNARMTLLAGRGFPKSRKMPDESLKAHFRHFLLTLWPLSRLSFIKGPSILKIARRSKTEHFAAAVVFHICTVFLSSSPRKQAPPSALRTVLLSP